MEAMNIPFNDNERFSNKPPMSNVPGKKPAYVEDIARQLVSEFGTVTGSNGKDVSWKFYCKAAHKLDRTIIDRLRNEAQENGHNPGALFNYLVREELGELDDAVDNS